METVIGEKIKEFTSKVSVNMPIELGSDQHLDEINKYRKPIVFITGLLSGLNQSLREFYNSDEYITVEDIELLAKTLSLNAKFYAVRRKSKSYPYIKEALAAFNEERQLHKELTHDFKEFRMHSEDLERLKAKLKELNF